MPIIGNTIQIFGTFPDTIPNLINMTDVKVNIYLNNIIIYTIQNIEKVSTGFYKANYTISNKDPLTPLIIEFIGVVDGYNYIGRTQLNRSYT